MEKMTSFCYDFIAMNSYCNGLFASFAFLCLQTYLLSFLTTGYIGKYMPVVNDFYRNEIATLAV